jgi:hypothetical protein
LEALALKRLLHSTYKKEYAENTSPGRFGDALGIGGILFAGGALLGVVAGLGGLVFGLAAAPAIIAGSLLGVAMGVTGVLAGSVIATWRAERALERDIDNGTLVKRFEAEALTPAARQLRDVSAAVDFAAAVDALPATPEGPAAVPASLARISPPKAA